MHSNSPAARFFSRGPLVLLALVLLSARAGWADHPETCWDGSVEIDSEPGDPIGQGERYTLYPEDANPTLGFFQRTEGPVREGYASGITIFFRGIGRNWSFEFSTWKLDTGLVPTDRKY